MHSRVVSLVVVDMSKKLLALRAQPPRPESTENGWRYVCDTLDLIVRK